MMQPKSLKEIKHLYDQGANVMRLFRDLESNEVNSLQAILASYDLQAGSYVERLKDPDRARFLGQYTGALAAMFDRYAADSVMEVGVGEATTFVNVLRQMRSSPRHALGFDLSWSRLAVAREYAAARGVSPLLFVGSLTDIPVEDDAVEVVYTSHSIEPNRGREKQILAELFRVTRRYLVLLEPSNELGGEATRRHIEEHKYCLDLCRHARELNFQVVEHRLFDYTSSECNQTALLVIAKDSHARSYSGGFLACPVCHRALITHQGSYFCTECLVAYPVLGGLPCLLASHGVVATRYLEKA